MESVTITIGAVIYGIFIIAEVKTGASRAVSSAVILFTLAAFFCERIILKIKHKKITGAKSAATVILMALAALLSAAAGIYWLIDQFLL
jgi:hypothetical protein